MLVYQWDIHDIPWLFGIPIISLVKSSVQFPTNLAWWNTRGCPTWVFHHGQSYPLVNKHSIAIENHHRNSGFCHWKWWFSMAILNDIPESMPQPLPQPSCLRSSTLPMKGIQLDGTGFSMASRYPDLPDGFLMGGYHGYPDLVNIGGYHLPSGKRLHMEHHHPE